MVKIRLRFNLKQVVPGQCRALLSTAPFDFEPQTLANNRGRPCAISGKNWCGFRLLLKNSGCYTDTHLDCKVVLSDENQSQLLLKVIVSKVCDTLFCSPHFALQNQKEDIISRECISH
jgi:hypothetical protein